jgi:hypothetical protein
VNFAGRLLGLLLAAPFVALAVVIEAPCRFVVIMWRAWNAQLSAPAAHMVDAVTAAMHPKKQATHEGNEARH